MKTTSEVKAELTQLTDDLITQSDAGPLYYMAIDLDNNGGAGDYTHTQTGGIVVHGYDMFLQKSATSAAWVATIGVILRIDGTDADIAYPVSLTAHNEDTGTKAVAKAREPFPVEVNLEVSGGRLVKGRAYTESNVAAVNTGATLTDAYGNSRTPAVGDLVIKVERVLGAGTCDFHYSLFYRTVA